MKTKMEIFILRSVYVFVTFFLMILLSTVLFLINWNYLLIEIGKDFNSMLLASFILGTGFSLLSLMFDATHANKDD